LDALADVEVQYKSPDLQVDVGNNGGIFPSVPFYATRPSGHRLSKSAASNRLDVYVGPFCEESRHALTAIQNISTHYDGQLEVVIHLFPLSYNLGSFIVARAMYAVDLISNGTAFWPYLFDLYARQPDIKAAFVSTLSNNEMVVELADLAASHGINRAAFNAQMGYNATNPLTNSESYVRAKAEWKEGCARGVFATPSFFFNHAQIPELGNGEGSTLAWLSFDHWQKVLDKVVPTSELRNKHRIEV